MPIFEQDRVKKYYKKHAIIIGYISPRKFLNLHSIGNNLPGSYIDPSTQKYLQKAMKYDILRIYWDVEKGKDIGHDGRNRAYFLMQNKVKSAKVMVLFCKRYLIHEIPVPVNEITKEQFEKFKEETGIRILGKPRRWNEITTPIKIKK